MDIYNRVNLAQLEEKAMDLFDTKMESIDVTLIDNTFVHFSAIEAAKNATEEVDEPLRLLLMDSKLNQLTFSGNIEGLTFDQIQKKLIGDYLYTYINKYYYGSKYTEFLR